MPNLSKDAASDKNAEWMYSPPPTSGWRRWRAFALPFAGRLVGLVILAAMLVAGCWWVTLWMSSIKVSPP